MQAEIDRLRDAVHDLRSRLVVLEVTAKSNEAMLHRLENKVDTLARKDEIEDAMKAATQETKYRFWHTWQGIVTTVGATVVLAVALLNLWDRFF
jgi:uncharacterized protein YigA (DUF484 family)